MINREIPCGTKTCDYHDKKAYPDTHCMLFIFDLNFNCPIHYTEDPTELAIQIQDGMCSKSMDPEFTKTVDDNFWDLVENPTEKAIQIQDNGGNGPAKNGR